MDTIFKMVVLSWLLTVMSYHANAADMKKSTTPFINSAQSSNEDCDLSLQQCCVIHGRSNDCYSKRSGQIKACAGICNPDDYKQRCKRLCPEFTYTGNRCEDSMPTSIAITSTATTRVHNATTRVHNATTTTDHNATATAMGLADASTHHIVKKLHVIATTVTSLTLLVLFIGNVAVCRYRKSMCKSCGSIQGDMMECKEEVTRTSTRRPLGYDNGSVEQCGKLAEPEFWKSELDVIPEEITGSSLKKPTSFDNTKCKGATKHGSLKMEVEGRIFNLQTAVMDGDNCEEFTKLPDELVNLIKDTSSKEGVSSAMLYQSPSDSKELLIVGVGADKNVEAKLHATVREQFSDFAIYTDAINHYSEHTKNYSRHAFIATKETFIEAAKKFEEVQTATCELVLEGESIAANDITDTSYYAFLPAHFVLEQRDMEMLLAEDVHPGALKHVQESTAGKSINNQYELSLLYPQKSIPLRSSDAMFSYRRFQQGAREGPEHFSFYNDSYLLELEKRYLYQRKDSIISFEELEEAMSTRQDGKVLAEVLPIRQIDQLQNMAARRVRIEVGPSSGYMVSGVTSLDVDGRSQLHHIQLVVEDWPLNPGHSGSIVYVIDTDNGHRIRFGMLVGLARRHHRKDQKIYQAIVLVQAIDELEDSFRHKVRNLKPLGSSPPRTPTVLRRLLSRDEEVPPGTRLSADVNGNSRTIPQVFPNTPVQPQDSL